MNANNYIPTYTGPSYADLPMEIILHIMNYLHSSDIYASSMTCHRWFEASQHPNFISKMKLNFSRIHLTITTTPLAIFLNNLRNYTTVTMNQVDFGETADFWDHFSESIKEISFKNCDIREKTLNLILTKLVELKSLGIDNCRELFMTGRLFENDFKKQNVAPLICQNIQNLSLTNNRYLSDALFNRFVTIMPKLNKLDLSGCHISFHKGLYKKFYPNNQKTPSESVFTFHCISQFIEQQALALKHLNFGYTLIDGSALTALAGVKNLKLETLILKSCDQLTNIGITNLVQTQISLQELDLSYSVRLTDPGVMEICKSLPNLRTLKLRRCRAITDIGVKDLVKLNSLNVLDISECELITSRGIVEGIASKRRENILEMYLSALNICEMAIVKVATNCPNMRVLDLSFCKNAVTDKAIQVVLESNCWLRELNLEYCNMISDASITGMGVSKLESNIAETDNLNLSQMKPSTSNKQIQQQPLLKISLRTKAEQDIVEDAKRKRMMLEMYENNQVPCESSGQSIDNVKGLRILNLTACNKITDVSLKFSFKLGELKELSLSKCQQISSIGLASIIQNCTSLEVMNLAECHNIDDKTIKLITEKLKRLTHLYLERCTQLTDHSLDYIAINCTTLKYLDVRGCRLMCYEPNLRLVNLTSLKHVAFSKPGPYLMDSMGSKQPKPPPIPLTF